MNNLYILATPIGNLQDITLRAIDTLKHVDLVVCEDTRITGKLLHHFSIKKPMKALNEFNEDQVIYEVLDQLEQYHDVALVSDAGTPLISDPGFRLVREARKKGYTVIPIPGPSAVVAALSASGLGTDKFLFLGFLAKNKAKKSKLFAHVRQTVTSDYCPTVIFYESPHRIVETLQLLHDEFGNIDLVIAREMTKIHEDIVQKSIKEWYEDYLLQEPKGELTLLFSPRQLET